MQIYTNKMWTDKLWKQKQEKGIETLKLNFFQRRLIFNCTPRTWNINKQIEWEQLNGFYSDDNHVITHLNMKWYEFPKKIDLFFLSRTW